MQKVQIANMMQNSLLSHASISTTIKFGLFEIQDGKVQKYSFFSLNLHIEIIEYN